MSYYKEIDHPKQWKYAHPEREKRFLLKNAPEGIKSWPFRMIHDKYLHHTFMRLRKTIMNDEVQYKLTKKLTLSGAEIPVEWTSTIYLNEQEYQCFDRLPGNQIIKNRYYLQKKGNPIIGVDEIKLNALRTIWIAEIELEDRVILPNIGGKRCLEKSLRELRSTSSSGFFSIYIHH